ncbi:MAG: hypothetical protein RI907_3631 [Pseudomonadota bacterium]
MIPARRLLAALSLTVLTATAWANDPKATIEDLDARLRQLGAVKVDGTERAGDKQVPGLFFGARKINNNYDLVDDIKRKSGATATVFVKDGDEFVRVSTNVLTPEGKRGVGTLLARAKAYEALKGGQPFCGDVDVLGTAFSACYHPIKDAQGTVVGASYIGFKK